MTPPEIKSYRFGEVVVDGNSYTRDVIILPDRVVSNWWRNQGHSLSVDDLAEVLSDPPEVLVIGRGTSSIMNVPAPVKSYLEEKGIEVIAESSSDAWRTYNRLRDQRKVAAALHLTC